MPKDIAIKIDHISKKYILRHQKPTLVESLVNLGKREEIWSLKDISLEIRKGERIGIIGNNGAGKTTLLKILSGITAPTSGSITVMGKIAALIDLEAGFHPELTGEENIYLNGMLLGMSKTEIKAKLKQIIEFSGLGKFIDAPFYTYSSGMALRLGFSIAIHSNPDILLVDEILAVGDQEFQKKSFAVVQDFFKKEKTVIYISHSLESISELCSRTIWIRDGQIELFGKTPSVIKKYKEFNNNFLGVKDKQTTE